MQGISTNFVEGQLLRHKGPRYTPVISEGIEGSEATFGWGPVAKP